MPEPQAPTPTSPELRKAQKRAAMGSRVLGVAGVAGAAGSAGYVAGIATADQTHDLLLEAIKQAGAVGGVAAVVLIIAYLLVQGALRSTTQALVAAAEERREAGERHATSTSALREELTAARKAHELSDEKILELIRAQSETGASVSRALDMLLDERLNVLAKLAGTGVASHASTAPKENDRG